MSPSTAPRAVRRLLPLAALLPFLVFAVCSASRPAGPMVYCALDEQFSRPLLERYARELGLEVTARYDSEAAKTVGLVSAIVEERDHPRCSVFWNNELAHTVRLAQAGLLEPYRSPSAAAVPAAFKDPEGRWTGFAARARVIVVNTELLPRPADWPRSYKDLADPKWRSRCAVAKPRTGTTLTHFTALEHALGEAEFGAFFDRVIANDVKFLASNGATLRAAATGQVAWAFTDTDDYHVAKQNGQPLACVFPDQGEGELGTMLIPNSVALIRGGPHAAAARRLVDRILAAETEALLAAAAGAQLPLRPGVPGPDDPALLPVGGFRAMAWDVEWTAAHLADSCRRFDERLGL